NSFTCRASRQGSGQVCHPSEEPPRGLSRGHERARSKKDSRNNLPQKPRPPPRSGEGVKDRLSSRPLRFGEGAGGRGSAPGSHCPCPPPPRSCHNQPCRRPAEGTWPRGRSAAVAGIGGTRWVNRLRGPACPRHRAPTPPDEPSRCTPTS